MRIVCGFCGASLDAHDWCDCRPERKPSKPSNFAEVVLTAAALDGKTSGPLEGEALRSAARARKELPS